MTHRTLFLVTIVMLATLVLGACRRVPPSDARLDITLIRPAAAAIVF